MFNQKLMKAMKDNKRLAWDVLTALRGSDRCDDDDSLSKRSTTGVIRKWALKKEVGWSSFFTPFGIVSNLKGEALKKRIKELTAFRSDKNFHFAAHIRAAARAIVKLENWRLPK